MGGSPLAAHPLVFDVQIMATNVIEEFPSIGCLQERDCRCAVVRPQIDIQQLASTDGLGDVSMGRALTEIAQENRSGTLALVMGPSWDLDTVIVYVGVSDRPAAQGRVPFSWGFSIGPVGRVRVMGWEVRVARRPRLGTVGPIIVDGTARSVSASVLWGNGGRAHIVVVGHTG